MEAVHHVALATIAATSLALLSDARRFRQVQRNTVRRLRKLVDHLRFADRAAQRRMWVEIEGCVSVLEGELVQPVGVAAVREEVRRRERDVLTLRFQGQRDEPADAAAEAALLDVARGEA